MGVADSWTTENFYGLMVDISFPESYLKITLEQLKHKEIVELTSLIAFLS
jgi:hypothetical protein